MFNILVYIDLNLILDHLSKFCNFIRNCFENSLIHICPLPLTILLSKNIENYIIMTGFNHDLIITKDFKTLIREWCFLFLGKSDVKFQYR